MILHYDEPGFSEALHKLRSSLEWQSPLHTRSAQNYYKEIPISEGRTVSDRSLIILWENQPIFAFIGMIVQNNSRV